MNYPRSTKTFPSIIICLKSILIESAFAFGCSYFLRLNCNFFFQSQSDPYLLYFGLKIEIIVFGRAHVYFPISSQKLSIFLILELPEIYQDFPINNNMFWEYTNRICIHFWFLVFCPKVIEIFFSDQKGPIFGVFSLQKKDIRARVGISHFITKTFNFFNFRITRGLPKLSHP